MSLGNGKQAGAVILGFVGGVVQRQAEHTSHEWLEFDADIWQSVKEDQELDEKRSSADELDVDSSDPSHRKWSVNPHNGEREAQQDGTNHSKEADFDSQQRGLEQERPEAAIADDAVHQRGLLRCSCDERTILGVGERGFLWLSKGVGDYRCPEPPAREDVAHFPAGNDTGECRIHFGREGSVGFAKGDSVGDLTKWRAGKFQVGICKGVVFCDGVVEEHTEEAAMNDIRVGIDLLIVGFHNDSRRLREHVERGRLAQSAD